MLAVLLALAFAPQPASPELAKGFDHFFNVEYEEALAIFRKVAVAKPDDAQHHNHVANAILYRAMLKAGALESELVSGSNPFLRREKMNPSPSEEAEFDAAIAKALEKAETRLSQSPRDANALYALGVTHALRANYNFLVRKAWYDALKDSTLARKQAQLALEADPEYMDARIIIGLPDYVVGSLSWGYKFLGLLAGIRGDREAGIQTLQQVAAQGVNNRADAQVLLAAIYRRESQAGRAVPLLEGLIKSYPRNYLFRLELAQMQADLGEREKAIEIMNQVVDLQRSQSPGFARILPEKLAYLRGNLHFWFDEYDLAVSDLTRALNARQELDLNTGLLACLRLGQTYDLLGTRSSAQKAYQSCRLLAPESEIGRECQRYLNRSYKRSRIE